jgi:acetyl esterase/lipase
MQPVALPLILVVFVAQAQAQAVLRDVPYSDPADPLRVLDIYAPADAKHLPVVFWIHGGGWQTGDKSEVALKPQWFMDRGCVFVSTNYRLLPNVEMDTLVRDVAQAIGWVHKHIAEHGGDPDRLLVMGHSAGAQLAALLCIDDRYLRDEGVAFSSLKGCVPVDGDTYDIPAIIEVAEVRCRAHGFPLPTFGHRQKFGNDPEKHVDFSAVTHIAPDKGIPPFLILYVSNHPDVTAQARRLDAVLKDADIPTTLFGARDTDHVKLNDNLGAPGDAPTGELLKFVDGVLEQ